MGEVISILRGKKRKTESIDKAFQGYGETQSIIWRGNRAESQSETFQDKVTRIKNSLEKINLLMKELKKKSEDSEDRTISGYQTGGKSKTTHDEEIETRQGQ